MCATALLHLFNIGLLLWRKRLIEMEPPPPTIHVDKSDITLMLYWKTHILIKKEIFYYFISKNIWEISHKINIFSYFFQSQQLILIIYYLYTQFEFSLKFQLHLTLSLCNYKYINVQEHNNLVSIQIWIHWQKHSWW